MSYTQDRAWSDQYLPAVRAIVGPRLLVPAPFDADVQRATDLVVMRAQHLDVAVRIRRYKYLAQYADQFTIRKSRDTGTKTELEKIMDGFADWFFYGFAAEKGAGLAAWVLVDLDLLRSEWGRRHLSAPVTAPFSNGDGTQGLAFYTRRIRPRVFIDAVGYHLGDEVRP
jgi:hypothetical protein